MADKIAVYYKKISENLPWDIKLQGFAYKMIISLILELQTLSL